MGLMASFERGMERFLVPVAIKLNSQKHVAAVRDGFVFTFPIITGAYTHLTLPTKGEVEREG
ncbi:hypothetical protein NLR32_24565, partial [Escherichia coli]|nr:hypothetical protein [Escherichia coli]